MSLLHGGYGVSAETFQNLIQERKDEQRDKVEQNRKDEVQHIRKLRHPLKRIPEEMWDIILKMLDDPTDRSNMWQVHGIFRELDNVDIKDFLLLQILDLPARPICTKHKEKCDCHSLAEKKSFAEHLQLRAVSRTVRNGVDRWYEKNLLKILHEGRSDGIKVPSMLVNSDNLRKAIQHFGKEGVQCVFTKSVTLRTTTFASGDDEYEFENDENDDSVRFKSDCFRLFRIIGEQIWHFKFSIRDFHEWRYRFRHIYIFLQKLVPLMPNLKWLELDMGQYDKVGDRKARLESKLFRDHPFPRLEHLERISVRYFYVEETIPDIFQVHEAAVKANPHAKIIDFGGHIKLKYMTQTPAPLQLSTFSLGGKDFNYHYVDRIIPIINFNWPLKRIQLATNCIKSVFNLFNRFPTLEIVTLHLYEVRSFEDVPFLTLPNLNDFECEIMPDLYPFNTKNMHFFYSLQFLLYSKMLRRLTWKNNFTYFNDNDNVFPYLDKLRRHMINHENKDNMINFRGGMRSLKFSNVWEVFPELEFVTVGTGFEDHEWEMKTHRRG